MSKGRSTNLASVKHKGMKYMLVNMYDKSEALDPPIPEIGDKSMHGIFHPELARFLCPRRDLEEYDEDHDTYVCNFMPHFLSNNTAAAWKPCKQVIFP